MMDPYISHLVNNQVSIVEFFHPAANSMPKSLLDQLTDALHDASQDARSKVIVLQAGGMGAFCAGASFNELAMVQNTEDGYQFFSGFANVLNAIRTNTKLVIGQIGGKCVGGGVGIAAACDFTVASNEAAVKLSELALGIGAYVIAPAIIRKIGLSAFSTLSLQSNQWHSAGWAHQAGLYNQLTENRPSAIQASLEIANNLASYSFAALQAWKAELWTGSSGWAETLFVQAKKSAELVLTPEAQANIKKAMPAG